ncbi:MAG: DUF4861 family protein [Ignavibacteriaceae bacterium]|nr:DUF4861 family protein [Ignavibacteriaceae bacterium]
MKIFFAIAAMLFVSTLLGCNDENGSFQIKIKNPNNISITDAFVEFDLNFSRDDFIIKDGDDLVPYQIVKINGNKNQVCLVINLESNQEKILTILFGKKIKKPEFKKRTYAELAMKLDNIYYEGRFRGNKFSNVNKIKVPAIHTDHDALFKYEGPGWESEKVGYRFYLDWRNATDIFGKKKDQLILANVGINDTVAKDDSYHSMQEWGMDIFKVGSSLGIGSIGMLHNDKVNMVSKTDSIYCEISQNGALLSEVKTNYYGWKVGEIKYNLESKLSITAGSRLTKNEIEISDKAKNIVTGLAKYSGTEFFRSDAAGKWTYIALYGNQTLVSANDKLGIALFYKTTNQPELSEDDLSYIVKLKPDNGKAEYYYCAAWEQEEKGIKNLDEFKNYLNQTLMILNNPLQIEIIN